MLGDGLSVEHARGLVHGFHNSSQRRQPFAEMATSELEFRGEYAFLRVGLGRRRPLVVRRDGARGVSQMAAESTVISGYLGE